MTVLACIGIGIGSFVAPLPVFFRLANAEQLIPGRVHDGLERTALVVVAVSDRARVALVGVLLAAVRRIDPKGTVR